MLKPEKAEIHHAVANILLSLARSHPHDVSDALNPKKESEASVRIIIATRGQ